MTSQAPLDNQPGHGLERARADAEVKRLQQALEELERRTEERAEELLTVNEQLRDEITQREQVQAALRASEERLRLALLGADLGMFDWNFETDEQSLNERGHEILGYSVGEFDQTGKQFWSMVHPDDIEMVTNSGRDHWDGRTPMADSEFRMRHKTKEWKWIRSRGKVVEWDENGSARRFIGMFLDIEDRKRAEEQLKQSLREKEALLREMHHRVKNNFSTVINLLQLQYRRLQNQNLRKLLKETELRVKCMQFVHEKLHRSESLDAISIRDYLSSLLESLMVAYNAAQRNIRLENRIDEVSLGVDAAIPLGFVTSELCSNSLKHAFPNGKGGEIGIDLHPIGEREFELVVSDNGIGMPNKIDLDNLPTLGLTLVQAFVRQLAGSMNWGSDQGTWIRVTFKEPYHSLGRD